MAYYNSGFTRAKDLSKLKRTEYPTRVTPKDINSKETLKATTSNYTNLGVSGGCQIHVTVPGKFAALTVSDDEISLETVPAGILPIWIKAIRFTDTTASGLLGLY